MLLNLYFSGIPGCVVKGVVSNPLFQIFLDPALYKIYISLYPEMNMILNFAIGIGTEAVEKYIKNIVSC